MAKIYYAPSGAILAYSHTDEEDAAVFAVPPAGQAPGSPLVFDEASNAAILDSLDGRVPGCLFQDLAIVNGAVHRRGILMPIAADADATTERKGVHALVNALAAGNATNAQVQRALAYVIRQLRKRGVL